MIAAQGMLTGQGIGVNSTMTSIMATANADPIVSGISSLQAKVSSLDSGSAATLTAILNSFPSTFANVTSTAAAVTNQANSMVPDVKTFISLYTGAVTYAMTSLDYGACLNQFSGKSFSDLGIGVSNFADANSNGLTSLVPGLSNLVNSAKNATFGKLSSLVDPTVLIKSQASSASSALDTALKSIAIGIGNYGDLFNFGDSQNLTPSHMVENIQKHGLADSTGLNSAIVAAGYSPSNLSEIPYPIYTNVLSGITGKELEKILIQMNVSPVANLNSAADLLDPVNVMPATAITALGIKQHSGIAGLSQLGNALTNIGVTHLNNAAIIDLLSSTQTKIGGYLANVTSLVPTTVSSTLPTYIGAGSSAFNTPLMSDLLGSAAGVHTNNFNAAVVQLKNISTSSTGQSIVSAMTVLLAAINASSGVSTALTALQSAATTFNAQIAADMYLTASLNAVAAAMLGVTTHISLENSNLTQAGLSLSSPPTSPAGSLHILNFADKLHNYGVDTTQLGHYDVLSGIATDSLTGDAIKAALLEGKNVSVMTSAGKIATTISDTRRAQATASASAIDSYISAYKAAKALEAIAQQQYDSLVSSVSPQQLSSNATVQAIQNAHLVLDQAKSNTLAALNKMQAAATTAAAKTKVIAAINS